MSDNAWNTVGSRGRGGGRGRPPAAEFHAEAAAAFGRKRGGFSGRGRGEDGASAAPPQSDEIRERNTDFDSKASMAFSRPKRSADERTSQVFSPAAAAAFGSVSTKNERDGEHTASAFQRGNSTGNEFGDTASSAFGKSTARSGFQDEMANIAFGKQRRTSDREGGFAAPRSSAMPSGIRNDLSSIVDSALGAAGTEVKSHWAGSALFKRKEPKKSAAVPERLDASNTIMFPSLGGSGALVVPKPVKSFSSVLRDSIAVDEKSAEEKAATEAAEETKRLSEAYDRRHYNMLGKRPMPNKHRTLSSESSDGLPGEDEESEPVEAHELTRKYKALIAPDVSASDYSEHPDEGEFHEEELAVAEEDS